MTAERHDCISCGKPGGNPSNGGLCDNCKVFGRARDLGHRSFTAMLTILSWGQR